MIGDREVLPSGPGGAFGFVYDVLLTDYPGAHISEKVRNHLVVRNQSFGTDTEGTEWIALNPAIAAYLGWKAADGGLFRWVDTAGEVMVETLWWADGNISLTPPKNENEVGEGWIVLASRKAFEAICKLVRSPRRSLFMTRSYSEEGRKIEAPSVQQVDEGLAEMFPC